MFLADMFLSLCCLRSWRVIRQVRAYGNTGGDPSLGVFGFQFLELRINGSLAPVPKSLPGTMKSTIISCGNLKNHQESSFVLSFSFMTSGCWFSAHPTGEAGLDESVWDSVGLT